MNWDLFVVSTTNLIFGASDSLRGGEVSEEGEGGWKKWRLSPGMGEGKGM